MSDYCREHGRGHLKGTEAMWEPGEEGNGSLRGHCQEHQIWEIWDKRTDTLVVTERQIARKASGHLPQSGDSVEQVKGGFSVLAASVVLPLPPL